MEGLSTAAVRDCQNLVGGVFAKATSGRSLDVRSPWTGQVIGRVGLSAPDDVTRVVDAAAAAQRAWARTPVKERVRPLSRFRDLVERHIADLSRTVSLESGKTEDEARAGIQRGLEVVDFALGIPNLDRGGSLEVSRGVTCEYRREPLGVVAGITPFNFPAMVPMWMFPIALTLGNAFVLKPSEKVPLTACRLGELLVEAGYEGGLFSVVHGDRAAVEALVDDPRVQGVGFVGSSAVARAVYLRAAEGGKRALCLGGAKNHLIVAPDADPALAVKAIVDSFTGCAGQRCMAGSVMVAVGEASALVPEIVRRAARLVLGRDMGALIDESARDRLHRAIARAEAEGAQVVLDGRRAAPPDRAPGGVWMGPTVLDPVRPGTEAATTELFGPVLSVVRVATLEEALALDGSSQYGNATAVFTRSGAVAARVRDASTSGMVGINVGVPVPRDPFSFGGTKGSRFGHGDMTGPGGIELWSQLKKITTKWQLQSDATWMG